MTESINKLSYHLHRFIHRIAFNLMSVISFNAIVSILHFAFGARRSSSALYFIKDFRGRLSNMIISRDSSSFFRGTVDDSRLDVS